MRKLLFVITLIFVISFTVFAQTDPAWKTFAPVNEEFSMEAPESLVLTKFSTNMGDNLKLYKTVANGTYFLISSDKADNSTLIKFAAAHTVENKAESTEIAIDNLQGEKFTFADAEGFYQDILIVTGKSRIYVFHTVSETKDNPAVERFFSSLRLDKTLPEANKSSNVETTKKIESSQNQDNQKIEMSSGSGRGNGNGLGSGSGNGTGDGASTNQTNPTASKNETSALKILSKPRANYTDLARFYDISGDVPLRVTFSANGEIGSISPVSKLPFGLTTNAIAAARNMKFEPAKKEGTPISVTKMVVYTFTIY